MRVLQHSWGNTLSYFTMWKFYYIKNNVTSCYSLSLCLFSIVWLLTANNNKKTGEEPKTLLSPTLSQEHFVHQFRNSLLSSHKTGDDWQNIESRRRKRKNLRKNRMVTEMGKMQKCSDMETWKQFALENARVLTQ